VPPTPKKLPALKGRSDSQGRNSAFTKTDYFQNQLWDSVSKPKEGGIIL
jgi:hypothetical protein